MTSGNRETEYNQLHSMIRHLYDVRMRAFNFTLAFNAALFTVVLQYLTDVSAQITVAGIAMVTTIVLLQVERRTLYAIDQYYQYGAKLEEELGYEMIRNVDTSLAGSRIRTRHYFVALYGLAIALWIAEIIFVLI